VSLSVGVSLVVGLFAVRRATETERFVRVLSGLLLVVGLGAIVSSVVEAYDTAGVGVVVGILVTMGVLRRPHATGRGDSVDAVLGIVLVHRLLEGMVLGALAAGDLAVGVVAAILLAVHTAAETAIVGGLYALNRRRRAILAVFVVQLVFVVGSVVGMTAVTVVPLSLRAALFGLSGGVFATVGVHAVRHPPKRPHVDSSVST
jgi:hypothetical protein